MKLKYSNAEGNFLNLSYIIAALQSFCLTVRRCLLSGVSNSGNMRICGKKSVRAYGIEQLLFGVILLFMAIDFVCAK